MFGPIIEGTGFRLRPPQVSEAEIYIGFFADIEVTRWLAHQFAPSLEFEREWVAARATDSNCITWAIEVEDRPVGITGIESIDWRNGVGVTGTVIGDKSAWGQGIGGELMRRRRDFAFGRFPFRKLRSGYVAPNLASARAQAAAGYREVGRYVREFFCEGEYVDHVLTEILREEWEELQRGTP